MLQPGAATPATKLPGRLSWSVTAAPFRLSFLQGTRPLVQESALSGGPGGRLSYRVAGGSFHALTNLISATPAASGTTYLVATDEPGRTASVQVVRRRLDLTIKLSFAPADGVIETFESFDPTPNEHFLGGGERPAPLDLRDQALSIKTAYACSNTMPAPFFLSSAGYGVSLRTLAITSITFPSAAAGSACAGGIEGRCPAAWLLPVVQLCAKAPSLTYTVFAGTPTRIVSDYTRTIGRPLLPPVDQFALIKWRDSVTGPSQLYEDVDRLHALHIPIGWVLLDNPWEQGGCYGTMRFDSRFPNPAGMIRALHARGVRFMLWISPLVRAAPCQPPPQYPPNALLGYGPAWELDLTNSAALGSFEQGLRSLIALGVDGFKADRGDGIDLESLELAGGSGVVMQNAYPLLYARAVAAAIAQSGRSAGFATLFRSGAPGSSAVVPGFWAGDQPGTFDGLEQAIHDGLSAGVAGYPIWGSDTGGYGSSALTREVFVRWAQFSAICPIFEVGGIGENATFWDFGSKTVRMFRDAAVLHYELFPYLYSLAAVAHATGLPVLRPLALQYPDDPRAWQNDLELLVGSDLLAAPVTTPATPYGVTQSTVYLPAGSWVDLSTGTPRVGGGPTFVRPTPLDELPLYLRSGAAIPFAARAPLLWKHPWPTDALQDAGRGGWLYAPARGDTRAATQDFGVFRASLHGTTLRIRLLHAPKQTEVLITGVRAPSALALDGRALPRARSLHALRSASDGWAPTTMPFPATVLKLAPHGGAVDVTLQLGSESASA
jgi:alpha-D-xyloside xylohydrolase